MNGDVSQSTGEAGLIFALGFIGLGAEHQCEIHQLIWHVSSAVFIVRTLVRTAHTRVECVSGNRNHPTA